MDNGNWARPLHGSQWFMSRSQFCTTGKIFTNIAHFASKEVNVFGAHYYCHSTWLMKELISYSTNSYLKIGNNRIVNVIYNCMCIIIWKSTLRGLKNVQLLTPVTGEEEVGNKKGERWYLCSAYCCTVCILYNKNVFMYNLIYNL